MCKGIGLIQPTEVRWNSMCDSIEDCIKNGQFSCKFAKIIVNIDIIRSYTKNTAMKKIEENMLAMLKPISVALNNMQRDNFSLSNVVNV